MPDDDGRVGYETYCKEVGGVSFNGDKLPTWEEQCERNPKIANAWSAAARATIFQYEQSQRDQNVAEGVLKRHSLDH
jgi:hypothetical protein